MRVVGVDIPDNKRLEIALRYIKGIGPSLSKKILQKAGLSPDIRAKDLKEADIAGIRTAVSDMGLLIEGELKRTIYQNIRRLGEIRSYRGERHRKGLPVNGQRTRSNARTRKGKKKTVMGTKAKKAGKKG